MMLSYLRNLYPEGQMHPEDDGFFFYTEKRWVSDWDEKGRTDENAGHLIQVICEPGRLTVVHENAVDEGEIRNNFRANHCF
jgi:hypothetical protein